MLCGYISKRKDDLVLFCLLFFRYNNKFNQNNVVNNRSLVILLVVWQI